MTLLLLVCCEALSALTLLTPEEKPHFLVFAELKKKKKSPLHSPVTLTFSLHSVVGVSKPVDRLGPLRRRATRLAFHSNSAGLRASQNVAAMPSELPRKPAAPGARSVPASVQNLVAFWGGV